jgi:hypothetical protein
MSDLSSIPLTIDPFRYTCLFLNSSAVPEVWEKDSMQTEDTSRITQNSFALMAGIPSMER